MKSTIYEYRDYKKLTLDLIETGPKGARGKRKALAEYIGCQVSHISNVLSGPAHFGPEQTEASARYFGLSSQETEFLLLLTQFNRAGTVSLKIFYEKLLDQKQKKYSTLKKQLAMPDQLQSEQEACYYSHWYFSAVHVLLSIPEFQTREAVAKMLNLKLALVDSILAFLSDACLISKVGQKYQVLRTALHLDKTSPLISQHHTNWRLKTLLSFDQQNSDALHYSSVFSLSRKDYKRVQAILTKSLSDSLKVIDQSPEEELAVICMDFYRP